MLREAGMTVIGGTLLFRLAESKKAQDVFRRLGEAGILVRGFDYRPDWLRFGIPGGEEEWRRLADALEVRRQRDHSPLYLRLERDAWGACQGHPRLFSSTMKTRACLRPPKPALAARTVAARVGGQARA